ncbi:hypothetical protein BkAM31D_15405 [Halalkalibacter krulwichiae]|uniref:Uncharacterized protein n=1 Tax=Halalkalibacter krulwichiae TaxID=199441 RepID=A0A1X9MKG8_9BACI|nr:hypothetical protein BkAM31D_15405 [Halalkalibacter krulwichiae]
MNLELIWNTFLSILTNEHKSVTFERKTYSGMPFLYITANHSSITQQSIQDFLTKAAAKAMKGKQLSCDVTFVRFKENTFVYRIRFLVPQKKMFCCGNGCTDCVRFKKQ